MHTFCRFCLNWRYGHYRLTKMYFSSPFTCSTIAKFNIMFFLLRAWLSTHKIKDCDFFGFMPEIFLSLIIYYYLPSQEQCLHFAVRRNAADKKVIGSTITAVLKLHRCRAQAPRHEISIPSVQMTVQSNHNNPEGATCLWFPAVWRHTRPSVRRPITAHLVVGNARKPRSV